MTGIVAERRTSMIDFLRAVMHPDNLFLRYALITGGLASISFGIIGTFVTAKRIGYLAGAISHSIFGGIGLALYLQVKVGLAWFNPLLGAILFALLAALIVGLVSIYAKDREDTIIGTLWAVGMAAGLLFIDRTPGYFDLSSYLFGDILLISGNDLLYIALLDILVLVLSLVFYNRFFAVCFDSEFLSIRGLRVVPIYLMLLILTSLAVVLMVRIVGIVLVIALLTIPPAIASFFARKLWHMMVYSMVLCLFFTYMGIAISYSLSLSTGPCIILVGGLVYLLTLLSQKLIRKHIA
jgi:zinc transport system permease protein